MGNFLRFDPAIRTPENFNKRRCCGSKCGNADIITVLVAGYKQYFKDDLEKRTAKEIEAAVFSKKIKDFECLYAEVNNLLKGIDGIGGLVVYNTALRPGKHIFPTNNGVMRYTWQIFEKKQIRKNKLINRY